MKKFNSVPIVIDSVAEKFYDQPFFSNATYLRLGVLRPVDAKHISRNLKKLSFEGRGGDGPFLDLPKSLESFNISLGRNAGPVFNCNVAYLTNLKDLRIRTDRYHSIIYKFPSCLVSLIIYGNSSSLTTKDISVCPNLTTIFCTNLRLSDNDTNGDPFRFSNKLKQLEVSPSFIRDASFDKYSWLNELPNRISVEDFFPKSLQILTLGIDYSGYLGSDSEFVLDLSKFKYLNSFSSCNLCIKIMNLPVSLTVLKLKMVKGINFKVLKNLMNLESLTLEDISHLPDLEINSPNLMYVNFNSSRIGKLTQGRFKFPSSVLEISMIYCEIKSIDESFQFPPQLQVLLLNFNELRHPPLNLPSNLKKLDLSFNNLEQLQTIPSFPESLKYLNIQHTGITKDKLGPEYDKLASNLVQLNM